MLKYRSELFFATIVCTWVGYDIAASAWPDHRHLLGALAIAIIIATFVVTVLVVVHLVRNSPKGSASRTSRISISETLKMGVEKGRASARKKETDQK